ncbi:hypothetical protein LCGC14_2377740 [marine sediment metagenome]|uniref:Uncharacterized protein n=1 Tax=marine sediment metagenome TaxID=412755 RepID=A0A0F9EE76_9ZZZZ
MKLGKDIIKKKASSGKNKKILLKATSIAFGVLTNKKKRLIAFLIGIIILILSIVGISSLFYFLIT